MEEKIRPGYIRVSEIISQWGGFGHIDKEVLERKKYIGTRVHSYIDAYLKMVPFVECQPEDEGYINSFLKWHDRNNPKVLCTERRFYSESLKITGCADAIFSLSWDNSPVIIDWKTSAQASQYRWKMQATFYMMLARESEEFAVADRAIFIQLGKHGENPKIHEYIYDKNVVEACVSAVNTYKYLASEGFCFE